MNLQPDTSPHLSIAPVATRAAPARPRLLGPAFHIAVFATLTTLSLLGLAGLLGLWPDPSRDIANDRCALMQTVAVAACRAVPSDDPHAVESLMLDITRASPQIQSAAVLRSDGRTLFESPTHAANRSRAPAEGSTLEFARVPIFDGATPWGTIELAFAPPPAAHLLGFTVPAFVPTLLAATLGAFLVFWCAAHAALRRWSAPSEHASLMAHLARSGEELTEKNRALELLAATDALTGCFNRRALLDHLHRAWSHAQRHSAPAACIMLDVDHFKAVNDTHGHMVGDAVLADLGALLRSVARAHDIVGRYGGEEFCFICPETDHGAAMALADRIRATIQSSRCAGMSITASFGISAREPADAGPETLIARADAGLYAAKHAGRNCIRSGGPPPFAKAA